NSNQGGIRIALTLIKKRERALDKLTGRCSLKDRRDKVMKTFLFCIWFGMFFIGICDIASGLTIVLAIHTLRMAIGSS
ncbi:MAG: hypothetical protein ACXWMO_11025, partial [Syntrophales bacterium]